MGVFEHIPSSIDTTEDFEASTVFQRAINYVQHEQFLESANASLDGYTYNVTNQDAFGMSQYGKRDNWLTILCIHKNVYNWSYGLLLVRSCR